MHQQLATAFVAAGHRVLFIENTGVRTPQFRDFGRIRDRIRNWRMSTRGFREIQENLVLFSPALLPFPYFRPAVLVNRFFLSRAVLKWMKVSHFENPVFITFLPTPIAQGLIHDIEPELTIYYCANHMAGSSPATRKLRPWEDLLFRNADLVFAISQAIRERASPFAPLTYSFPPGVDYAKFESARLSCDVPADIAALPRPVVGYIGALSDVLDKNLLIELARQMPDASIVLVGPEYTNTKSLAACSNIKLLGERPHDLVPAYIKGFDVALIPYVVNEFTDSVYSCKLNEYLAMGVPVVSTDMREIRYFVEKQGAVVEIGHDTADFIDKVRLALAEPASAKSQMRIMAAKSNGWNQRFAEISQVIERHLAEKLAKRQRWQEKLSGFYRRQRNRWVRTLSLLAAVYLLVFHTPFVWLLGDQLAVRHEPRVADAIVVFSGNGEAGYINQSYQRRAVDAIRYFKAGYAPLIILSSGKNQTFPEVEMIRSLLIDKGIPEQAIQILETFPHSTFENVVLVKGILTERSAKSILLITSPYHSRRALWVWRRVMPELLVLAPAVVDTPKRSPQWEASVDQMKVIGYEYLAIAYYWYKGWLNLPGLIEPKSGSDK